MTFVDFINTPEKLKSTISEVQSLEVSPGWNILRVLLLEKAEQLREQVMDPASDLSSDQLLIIRWNYKTLIDLASKPRQIIDQLIATAKTDNIWKDFDPYLNKLNPSQDDRATESDPGARGNSPKSE